MQRCVICENSFSSQKKIAARDGYYYLICPVCSGGNLMPRKKALKALKNAYLSQYFDWKEAVGLRKYLNQLQLFKSYPEWIEQTVGRNKGKVLDIGAGVPNFVYTMKKNGWDSYALEISKEQVKLIKKYIDPKKVWQGDFEIKRIPRDTFDVLTFWHMLEHLTYPAKAIRKSSRVLKNNGMLFAEFPNLNSFNLALFKTDYCHFDLPGHLVYYNKKSLENLFTKNGFKNIKISYPLKLNGSFSLNLMRWVNIYIRFAFVGVIVFYMTLPVSILLTVINSFLGKTDLMRISAVKA
jgi:2-polyprenyl-3-methyl-5-hydroxy-6-metoxy-1,4-benzoquinol methylase